MADFHQQTWERHGPERAAAKAIKQHGLGRAAINLYGLHNAVDDYIHYGPDRFWIQVAVDDALQGL